MLLKADVLIAGLSLSWTVPPTLPGFTLTWSDDFTDGNGSLPDPANWLIDKGTSYPGGPANWGTQEIQTYTDRPENLNISRDGVLQITPLRTGNNSWTSARIETQRTDFQAEPGRKMRISARIKMPDVTGDAAAGYWPAFWSLGDQYRGNYQNWPSVGEFDIMENVNGVNKVWGVLHCGTAPGGPCNEFTGLPGNVTCPVTPCQGNWHVYTLEVDRSSKPEKLFWFVDDVCYHIVDADQVGAEAWTHAVHHGHFILLNVAIGGAFPNANKGSETPTPATVPGKSLYVDWVAVYNSA